MCLRRRWSVACSSSLLLSKDEVGELQGMGIQLTGPPAAAGSAAAGGGGGDGENDLDCADVCRELFKEEDSLNE
jgi:hypothetical protein